MKKLCVIFIFLFAVVVGVSAQTECPADKVCISPAAARKAIEDGDARKALEADAKIKDQAIADLKDELGKIKIKFAEVSGENTSLKQHEVRTDAIIDLLLKNTRKKCMPLSVCF